MAKNQTYKEYLHKSRLNKEANDRYKRLGRDVYNSQIAHDALSRMHYDNAWKFKGKQFERLSKLCKYHAYCYNEQHGLRRILTKQERKKLFKEAMKLEIRDIRDL